MKPNRQIFTAALCATGLAGALHAQHTVAGVPGGPEKTIAFQTFFNSAEPGMNAIRVEALPAQAITGKPFSATEVRRTRQTLGDGTHIDKVEKDKFYRDFDGRTRIEHENGTGVSISDPTRGATRESTNGRARVVMMRSGTLSTAAPGERVTIPDKLIAIAPGAEVEERRITVEGNRVAFAPAGVVGVATGPVPLPRTMVAPAMPAEKGITEDLGDQVINGVRARGTRSTITIPQGQIGNDREIRVVSERWFSDDLGVLIKSTNNDPRFGETTFELTDILQGAQDPTLFDPKLLEMPPVKR